MFPIDSLHKVDYILSIFKIAVQFVEPLFNRARIKVGLRWQQDKLLHIVIANKLFIISGGIPCFIIFKKKAGFVIHSRVR